MLHRHQIDLTNGVHPGRTLIRRVDGPGSRVCNGLVHIVNSDVAQ